MKMDDESLDRLQRERESALRDVLTLKIRSLETKVQEKENLIQQMELRNREMQNDFQYNLSVIQDRDNEIKELTDKMLQLREILEIKDRTLQDLQSENYTLKEEADSEKGRWKTKEKSLLERLEDLKHENKFLREKQHEDSWRSKNEYEKQIKVLQDVIQGHESTINNLQHELDGITNNLQRETDKILHNLETQIKALKQERDDLQKNFNQKTAENNQTIHELQTKVQEQEKQIFFKNQEEQEKITDYRIQVKHVEKLNQDIMKENEELRKKQNNWGEAFQERYDQLKMEKEQLQEKMLAQKLKYKNKMNMLRDLNDKKIEDLIREQNLRSKKLEEDLKNLYFEREKLNLNERNLKERCQDLELKLQKEQRQGEDKVNSIQRNLEQDVKKLKNDLELKDFQALHLRQDLEDLQKKLIDIQGANNSLEKKNSELERENILLVEQITMFRNEKPLGEKSPDEKGKKRSGIKLNKLDQRIDQEILEDASYEQLFSEDMGPASPLYSMDVVKSSVIPSKPKMVIKNESNSYLIAEKNELLKENISLKDIIEKMRLDMENTRYSLQLKQQELEIKREENMQLRSRITSLEQESLEIRKNVMTFESTRNLTDLKVKELQTLNENLQKNLQEKDDQIKKLKETLEAKEAELATLKLKVLQSKNETEKLKAEREELIEISNNLTSKINRLEDLQEETADKNPEIEEKIHRQQALINKLYKLLPPSVRHEVAHNLEDQTDLFPERDENVRGSIERYKAKIEDVRNELYVESSKKPLYEMKSVYTPNSQKGTVSQKEAEQKLKMKTKKSSPPRVARNYNIKEDNQSQF